jgi:hypothetical protein
MARGGSGGGDGRGGGNNKTWPRLVLACCAAVVCGCWRARRGRARRTDHPQEQQNEQEQSAAAATATEGGEGGGPLAPAAAATTLMPPTQQEAPPPQQQQAREVSGAINPIGTDDGWREVANKLESAAEAAAATTTTTGAGPSADEAAPPSPILPPPPLPALSPTGPETPDERADNELQSNTAIDNNADDPEADAAALAAAEALAAEAVAARLSREVKRARTLLADPCALLGEACAIWGDWGQSLPADDELAELLRLYSACLLDATEAAGAAPAAALFGGGANANNNNNYRAVRASRAAVQGALEEARDKFLLSASAKGLSADLAREFLRATILGDCGGFGGGWGQSAAAGGQGNGRGPLLTPSGVLARAAALSRAWSAEHLTLAATSTAAGPSSPSSSSASCQPSAASASASAASANVALPFVAVQILAAFRLAARRSLVGPGVSANPADALPGAKVLVRMCPAISAARMAVGGAASGIVDGRGERGGGTGAGDIAQAQQNQTSSWPRTAIECVVHFVDSVVRCAATFRALPGGEEGLGPALEVAATAVLDVAAMLEAPGGQQAVVRALEEAHTLLVNGSKALKGRDAVRLEDAASGPVRAALAWASAAGDGTSWPALAHEISGSSLKAALAVMTMTMDP